MRNDRWRRCLQAVRKCAGRPQVPLIRSMSKGQDGHTGDRRHQDSDQHHDESPANTHMRNIDNIQDPLDVGDRWATG